MSSSSSAPSDGTASRAALGRIGALLSESFAVIARELPQALPRFAGLLGEKTIRVDIDAESVEVSVQGGAPIVSLSRSERPAAVIGTTSRTVLDVLGARLNLRDAVLGGSLRVTTELEQVEPLYAAILAYTHAAVRCPAFPELLEQFRRLADAPDAEEPAR